MTMPIPMTIKTYKPGSSQKQSFGICIYGKGGAGKTTLLGTMPGRGLIIDIPQVEGGTFVLEDKADRIDVTSVETWNEIQHVFWTLTKTTHNYQWVAIDSITAMTELAKRKTIQDRTLDQDPHTITLQEWGKIGRLVTELVYQFRTLTIHTIWIAQQRKFGGMDDGATEAQIGPDVSPSALAGLIPSMLLVGHLSVERSVDGDWERHLRIGPHPLYQTKCRAKPGLNVPPVVRKPHLGKILKYLLGSGERPEEVNEDTIIFG